MSIRVAVKFFPLIFFLVTAVLALNYFLNVPLSAQSTGQTYSLFFSTYLGGNNFEQGRDVAHDSSGNIFVTGGTQSTNFPTTTGPIFNSGTCPSLGSFGRMDVFITKFSPTGQRIWSRFLGGPCYDRAYAIEVDNQGFVYVAGRAGERFPTTAGVVQTAFAGDTLTVNSAYGKQDGFISKISPDGTTVVWSTYWGSPSEDIIRDLAIDGQGNVYPALTGSSQGFNQTSQGNIMNAINQTGFQKTIRGNKDGAIAKISPDAKTVLYASYFGGSGEDAQGPSVRVDKNGIVFVQSGTKSTDAITSANAFQKTNSGGLFDQYLIKINPQVSGSSSLLYASYFGGNGEESSETHYLAIDSSGFAYLAGETSSTNLPFSNVPGFKKNHSGAYDGFIAKINTVTGALAAGTYLGGSAGDGLEGVVVDTSGNVYVGGNTASANFPITANAQQKLLLGTKDGYVVKMSSDLSSLIYSTFIGGNDADAGRSLDIDSQNNMILVGETNSNNFPLKNPSQSTFAGGSGDSIVSKFNLSTASTTLSPTPTKSTNTPSSTNNPTQTPSKTPTPVSSIPTLSLNYSSFLGGTDFEYISDIEVDSSGNQYLVGSTRNASFLSGNSNGDSDIFIAKFSPTGTFIRSYLIGGSGKDTPYGLEIDGQGNIILSAAVASGFPTKVPAGSQLKSTYTANPYGVNIVFVKFKGDLSDVIWSGYFANGDGHPPREIDLDSAGNLYVISAADTTSTYPQAFLNSKNGGQDTVIVKLSGSGMGLVWGRYLGGSGNDNVGSIKLDPSGNVYIWSWTNSTDLPTTANAYDRSYNGGTNDTYLAKFGSDGTQVLYASYFGGSGDDSHGGKHNLDVDTNGNAYVVASTDSPNLPVSTTAFQKTKKSSRDIFVAKLSTTSNQLLGSTYVDNGDSEAIQVDSAGNVYIGGNTQSTTFPLSSGAFQRNKKGITDAVFFKLSPDLSTLLYGTYMGGTFASGNPWEESLRAIHLDVSGNVYLAGQSNSSDWPTTANAFQKSYGGGGDDIVFVKFSSVAADPTNTPTRSSTSTPQPSCTLKSKGDADCNGKVDLVDYEIWRKEALGGLTSKNANFNPTVDSLVDIVDFEIWRKGFYSLL